MSYKDKFSDLKTERLALRAMRLSDSTDFHEIYSDPEAMKYWSDPDIREIEETEKRMQADLDWVEKGDALVWSICDTQTGKALGKFVLFQLDEQNRRAEVGYVLNRKYWGKGLMSEVLARVMEYSFTELGLHRLEADVDQNNQGSLGLLEKAGFQREGYFRERWQVYNKWQDSVMLGLLEPEWREARGTN